MQRALIALLAVASGCIIGAPDSTSSDDAPATSPGHDSAETSVADDTSHGSDDTDGSDTSGSTSVDSSASSEGTGSDGTGSDGTGSSEGPAPALALPCDVQAALAHACTGCHGAKPAFEAPMPMTSLAELLAPAPSDPTRAVYDLVGERIVADVDPMPPIGALTDAERDALLTWIAAGAPGVDDVGCE